MTNRRHEHRDQLAKLTTELLNHATEAQYQAESEIPNNPERARLRMEAAEGWRRQAEVVVAVQWRLDDLNLRERH